MEQENIFTCTNMYTQVGVQSYEVQVQSYQYVLNSGLVLRM